MILTPQRSRLGEYTRTYKASDVRLLLQKVLVLPWDIPYFRRFGRLSKHTDKHGILEEYSSYPEKVQKYQKNILNTSSKDGAGSYEYFPYLL